MTDLLPADDLCEPVQMPVEANPETLVERLRNHSPGQQWCHEGGLFWEAAAEIERLRADVARERANWNRLYDINARLIRELPDPTPPHIERAIASEGGQGG